MNGNLTLVIARATYDAKTGKPVGYPCGTIPRLLLFWLTAEAVRTQNRRIELGSSLASFMREIGLHPRSGTGRGDAFRLRNQMTRLFGASISFQQTGEHVNRWLDMKIAPEGELWWDPKRPDQTTLWGSWVLLGEQFFSPITASPVPLDPRALRALKQSPLALDLYAWATYKAFVVNRKGVAEYVSWTGLQQQLGADYGRANNFRQKTQAVLRKIQAVYPAF